MEEALVVSTEYLQKVLLNCQIKGKWICVHNDGVLSVTLTTQIDDVYSNGIGFSFNDNEISISESDIKKILMSNDIDSIMYDIETENETITIAVMK